MCFVPSQKIHFKVHGRLRSRGGTVLRETHVILACSVFSDSRNVQKSVTQIIYLGPLPKQTHTLGLPDQLQLRGSRDFTPDKRK